MSGNRHTPPGPAYSAEMLRRIRERQRPWLLRERSIPNWSYLAFMVLTLNGAVELVGQIVRLFS